MKTKSIPPRTKRVKSYEIKWHPGTINYDTYYEVLADGECLMSFETYDKAAKYVEERKNTVILRTKRLGSYFRGVVMKCYFPMHGHKFFTSCVSGSGGGRSVSLLSVMDFKADTENGLLRQLHAFKRKHNLILERL